MSMMPPATAIVINQPEISSATNNADAVASATVSLRVQKEKARREERQRTRAILAKFEARLHELTTNPPAELSPVKLQAHLESLQHTIADLRRQIAPRRKSRLSGDKDGFAAPV